MRKRCAALVAPLVDVLIDEQQSLWSNLDEDIRSAINGTWSIAAGNTARRIVRIARLVGATDPGSISYPIVSGGVYAAVLAAGRLDPPVVWDEAEWQRTDDMMRAACGTRELNELRFAATVAAIQNDTAWISGDEG